MSVRGGGCYRSVSPPAPETRSTSATRKKKKERKNFALIGKRQKAHHLSQPHVYSFSYSLSIQVKQHVNRKLNSFVPRSVLSCLNIHVVSAFPLVFLSSCRLQILIVTQPLLLQGMPTGCHQSAVIQTTHDEEENRALNVPMLHRQQLKMSIHVSFLTSVPF